MDKDQKLIRGFLNGDRRDRERTLLQSAWLLMVLALLFAEFSQGQECRIVFENCQMLPKCAKALLTGQR